MELAETYNVSEFRKKMKTIFQTIMEVRQGTTVIKRHGDAQAVILPANYKVLTEKKIKYGKWLAFMITENLLPKAPTQFKEPQMKELQDLPLRKLFALMDIKRLPLSVKQRGSLSRTVGKPVIQRLEKRHEIAQAIAEAEEQGLYDVVESQTGEVDLT